MFSRLVNTTFKEIHSVSGKGTTGCVNLEPQAVPNNIHVNWLNRLFELFRIHYRLVECAKSPIVDLNELTGPVVEPIDCYK